VRPASVGRWKMRCVSLTSLAYFPLRCSLRPPTGTRNDSRLFLLFFLFFSRLCVLLCCTFTCPPSSTFLHCCRLFSLASPPLFVSSPLAATHFHPNDDCHRRPSRSNRLHQGNLPILAAAGEAEEDVRDDEKAPSSFRRQRIDFFDDGTEREEEEAVQARAA
jgi:hypothetical protein